MARQLVMAEKLERGPSNVNPVYPSQLHVHHGQRRLLCQIMNPEGH